MTTTATTTAAAGPDRPPARLLIDIRELAGLLARSVPALERDQAAGRLPAPVRVGGSKRWRRAEIEAWVDAGCPDRAAWDARRTAEGRR